MGDKAKYSVADLVADESFCQWVTAGQPQDDSRWYQFRKDAEYSNAIREAVEMLQLLEKNEQLASFGKASVWQAVEREIAPARRLPRWSIAAAILLLITATTWFWPSSIQDFETQYADQQHITLPDGTTVVLEANSHLWWDGEWATGNQRKVSLRGEAYFDVVAAALAEQKPFVISTSDFDVQVVGTAFAVVDRPSRQGVTLVEGKVLVTRAEQTFNLQPDQALVLGPDTTLVQAVNAMAEVAWREKVWNVEAVELRSVVQRIEDNFGYKVVLEPHSLETRELSGAIPAASGEKVARAIGSALNLQWKIDRKTITLSTSSSDD